jgi:death-on-curing protein
VRYLTLDEVLRLHGLVIEQSGGIDGLRDSNALESAVAQPQMTFGGEDLYPTLVEKASALGFSLIKNHAFIDGNKRVGHAALETFLVLNGYELDAPVDEQEEIILGVSAGTLNRDDLTQWLRSHVTAAKR